MVNTDYNDEHEKFRLTFSKKVNRGLAPFEVIKCK